MRKTIRGKFALGFGSLIVFLVVVIFVSHQSFDRINRAVVKLADVEVPLEKATMELEINTKETARAVLDYLRDRHPDERRRVLDSEADFERYEDEFSRLAETVEEKRLGKEVADLYKEFKIQGFEIMDLEDVQFSRLGALRKNVIAFDALIDDKIQASIDKSSPEGLKKIESSYEMEINIHEGYGAVEAYLVERNPDLREEIKDAQSDFERYEATYRKTHLSANERVWMAQVDELFVEAKKDGDEVMDLEDKKQELLVRFEGHLAKIDEILDERIQPLIHVETVKAKDDARRFGNIASAVILTFGLLGILVGLGVFISITRIILNPLTMLKTAATEIGRGNLDARIEVGALDEIGELARSFDQMARDLRMSRDEIVSAHDYADNIISSMTDMLIVVSTNLKIQTVNEATCKVLGFTEEELLGQQLNRILEDDESSPRSDSIGQFIKGGAIQNIDRTYIAKDGERIPVLFSSVVMSDPRENIQRLVCVARDFGGSEEYEGVKKRKAQKLKKAYSELRESQKASMNIMEDLEDRKNELLKHQDHLEEIVDARTTELAALNKELESFSYSVAHDLRGPLRAIDGFGRALEEDYGSKLDDKAKGFIEMITNGSQQMGVLIDDLLTLSRVTRGEIAFEKIDITAMAAEIEATLKKTYPENTVKFVLNTGLEAKGDPNLIRLMLTNLLENAWKFTGKTTNPLVEFGTTTQEGEDFFFIRDNGVGFDQKYAHKLFTPFQRLHSVEEYVGTGIGLAIVQRVINRHGGNIRVEGEEGVGVTFYFRLSPD